MCCGSQGRRVPQAQHPPRNHRSAPQGQQHEQKRRQMGVADRAMYGVGQLVYQSPAARLVALCYLLVMHTLVLGSLGHVSHKQSGALMDHMGAALEDHSHAGRHDLTAMLTHDGGGAAAVGAGAAAAKAAAAAAGRATPRLLRRLLGFGT